MKRRDTPMTKVWAFTMGSYSDYRVECLFTTKELAIAYAAGRSGKPVDWWTRYLALNDEWDATPMRQTGVRRQLDNQINDMYRELEHTDDCGITTFDLYDNLPAIQPEAT